MVSASKSFFTLLGFMNSCIQWMNWRLWSFTFPSATTFDDILDLLFVFISFFDIHTCTQLLKILLRLSTLTHFWPKPISVIFNNGKLGNFLYPINPWVKTAYYTICFFFCNAFYFQLAILQLFKIFLKDDRKFLVITYHFELFMRKVIRRKMEFKWNLNVNAQYYIFFFLPSFTRVFLPLKHFSLQENPAEGLTNDVKPYGKHKHMTTFT